MLWQTVGYSEPRKINQFDFSYLGSTKLDLIIIVIGVHFSYYDPDRFVEMLRTFLPAVKEGVASREHWFMDNNRYCGVSTPHCRPTAPLPHCCPTAALQPDRAIACAAAA